MVTEERAYYSHRAGASEFFLWSGDRLVLALRERADRPSDVGSVYLGRVTKVDRNLGAAFVDLDGRKTGMLPLRYVRKVPHEGESLIAQVRRDAMGDKAPRLSHHVEIDDHRKVDFRATGEPRRLCAPWPIWFRALSEREPETLASVVCDRRVDTEAVGAWVKQRRKGENVTVSAEIVESWRDGRDQALDEIALALEADWRLPGGGRLFFEPGQTLTAIDVDSASASADAFAIDCAAAAAIPWQLSLRNIGGLVVVDFIDVTGKAKRESVVLALRQAARADPMTEWVGSMSRLGLVEMQRRRNGPTLNDMWRDLFESTPA